MRLVVVTLGNYTSMLREAGEIVRSDSLPRSTILTHQFCFHMKHVLVQRIGDRLGLLCTTSSLWIAFNYAPNELLSLLLVRDTLSIAVCRVAHGILRKHELVPGRYIISDCLFLKIILCLICVTFYSYETFIILLICSAVCIALSIHYISWYDHFYCLSQIIFKMILFALKLRLICPLGSYLFL